MRTEVRGKDSGFTLIELAVAMVIVGILMAMAAPSWRSYQANQERVSAAAEAVSALRTAQIRATAEEATYRVDVDAATRTLSIHRFDGSTYVLRSSSRLEGSSVRIDEAGFTNKAGVTSPSAFFYPRGTASPGKLVVSREGRDRKHTITVEGLTGRVSSN